MDKNELVTLASDWTPEVNPTGYWMSEKMDGVLALWNGEKLLTRSGLTIKAPDWFTSSLPGDALLGELFAGRKGFNHILSVIRRGTPRDFDWASVMFKVFDAPGVNGIFEERLYFCCQTILSIQDIWRGNENKPKFVSRESLVHVADQVQCKSKEHFDEFHTSLVAAGAEGSMLRKPRSQYSVGRSGNLLRRKDWFQEEAEVIGHNFNVDKSFRSLKCQLLSDKSIIFDVGSGLTKEQVDKPIPRRSVITVKYKQKLENALREPSFICVRDYE